MKKIKLFEIDELVYQVKREVNKRDLLHICELRNVMRLVLLMRAREP